MTEKEIKKAIFNGQGRAILHFRANPSPDNLPLFVSMCKRRCIFAKYLDSRQDYLCRLADTLPDPHACVEPLAKHLFVSRDDVVRGQIRAVLGHLRAQGNELARQSLIKDFKRWRLKDNQQHFAPCYLGWEGLELVLSYPKRIDKFGHVAFMTACDEFGKETARKWLEDRAKSQKGAAEILNEVDGLDAAYKKADQKRTLARTETAQELIQLAREGKKVGRYPFANIAKEKDWIDAANLALETKDVKVLGGVRKFFREKPWPLEVPELLKVIDEDTDDLKFYRVQLLDVTKHPAIRPWVLEKLKKPLSDGACYAFDLLELNGERKDWPLMYRVLKAVRKNPWKFHSMHYAARLMRAGVATSTLQLIYEFGPCSMCRNRAVEILAKRRALSDEQILECLEDSDDDSRALANKLLKKLQSP